MNHVMKRTLTGLAVGAGVIAFFLYCPLKAVPFVLVAFSTVVQLEFYLMAKKKYEPVTWFGLLAGAGWLIGTAAAPGTIGFAASAVALVCGGVPLLGILACIVLFSSRYRSPIGTFAVTVLGFLYVPFLMSFFLRLVQLAPDPGCLFAMPEARTGLYSLLALIALAKFSDTGGFAFGVSFGKHKMCPSISPKKSWEGFVGSMIFASATLAVFHLIAQRNNWADTCAIWQLLSGPAVIPCGIVFALVATAGDLVESRFKRECDVKDSATFMPAGMGGFLDMVDSILILPALVYPLECYLYWNPL